MPHEPLSVRTLGELRSERPFYVRVRLLNEKVALNYRAKSDRRAYYNEPRRRFPVQNQNAVDKTDDSLYNSAMTYHIYMD